MHADHIIIGSGLSALGVALGLPAAARIIVVTGAGNQVQTYPGNATPASYLGPGGMGNFWHGIIPVTSAVLDGAQAATASDLLTALYPGGHFSEALGSDQIFVPWRAVRPMAHWTRLTRERRTLTLLPANAESFSTGDGAVTVRVSDAGQTTDIQGKHLWVAAGALHTPGLLARSLGWPSADRTVNDHMIAYVGQTPADAQIRRLMQAVRRDRHGVWLPTIYGPDRQTVFGLRPARFDFRRPDRGIEMRADFGLPTSRAAAAIAGRLSAGLIAETLFNKAGLFPHAALYNAFMQLRVENAYALSAQGQLGERNRAAFAAAGEQARRRQPFAALTPTRRPDLFQPGIHFHGSLTEKECATISTPALARVKVVDASAIADIGPEHHSFKIMLRAYRLAQEAA
ncbi:MAG: hypothetical protein ACRCXM_17490 [Beijerinckiaceae bacterium]